MQAQGGRFIQREQYEQSVALLKKRTAEQPEKHQYYIRTFGCQQNVSDSERVAGMLEQSGYQKANDINDASLILFNTCAVREHAEDRVFGNVGEIKRLKEKNKNLVIALGGCMVQQQHIADKLKKSYPFVDILFNTNDLQTLPTHIEQHLATQRSVVAISGRQNAIFEGLPIRREERFRAFIPVMYGCDNFCSYCVVPLVRGRERSRRVSDVIRECEKVVSEGYKDIMLLGQNVNSYGKGLTEGEDFPALLERICKIEGDFTLRFMTSHPKDASKKLFDTISANPKISRHIHLPVQSGSDRVLREMNRRYTIAEYVNLVQYARSVIRDISFSSDIIVGFPGETEEEFEDTLRLIQKVGYRSLFTFIYSKRQGTPAACLQDGVSHKTKVARMTRLLALQDDISEAQDHRMVGMEYRALVTQQLSATKYFGRLDDNRVVTLLGPGRENAFVQCVVSSADKRKLYGEIIA